MRQNISQTVDDDDDAVDDDHDDDDKKNKQNTQKSFSRSRDIPFSVHSSKHYFSFVSAVFRLALQQSFYTFFFPPDFFLHSVPLSSFALVTAIAFVVILHQANGIVQCTCVWVCGLGAEDACNHFEIDANVILTPKSCGKNVIRIH